MGEKEEILLKNGGNKRFKDSKTKKTVKILSLLLATTLAGAIVYDKVAGEKISTNNKETSIEYSQQIEDPGYRYMIGKDTDNYKNIKELLPTDVVVTGETEDHGYYYIMRREKGKPAFDILSGKEIDMKEIANANTYNAYDVIESEDVYGVQIKDSNGEEVVVVDGGNLADTIVNVIPDANEKINEFRQQVVPPKYRLMLERSTGNVGEKIEVLPSDIPLVDIYDHEYCIMRLEEGKKPYDIISGKHVNAGMVYNSRTLNLYDLVASNEVYSEHNTDEHGQETVVVDLGSLADYMLNIMPDYIRQ